MIDRDKGWARPSDQALAVPAKPASGLVASRFDPSRGDPVVLALSKIISDQEDRYRWMLDFAERRRAGQGLEARVGREVYRERVGERSRKIARILARDGEDCCYCHKPLGEDMTLEHRVARSNGGSDELDNLKLSHAVCNREVGNLPVDLKDALASRKREQAKRLNEESKHDGAGE